MAQQKELTPRHKRFLEAVKRLDLKFEVSEIVKRTGYKKSTVSGYLNDREPSEDFLRTFCESFKLDFEEIWGSKQVKIKATDMAALEYIDLYAMSRVILGILAEMESKQSGEMVQSVLNKYQRAVEAEREAKRKELSELLGSS